MRNTLMRRPTTSLLDDFFNDEFFLPNSTNNTHLDVYQEEDKYVVEVDLPGYKKEEIHISYENGILSLGAKKEDKKDADDTEHHYIRRERASVSFSRQFTVKGIKEEGIKAALKDGILTITLPKEEEKSAETSRQITID